MPKLIENHTAHYDPAPRGAALASELGRFLMLLIFQMIYLADDGGLPSDLRCDAHMGETSSASVRVSRSCVQLLSTMS